MRIEKQCIPKSFKTYTKYLQAHTMLWKFIVKQDRYNLPLVLGSVYGLRDKARKDPVERATCWQFFKIYFFVYEKNTVFKLNYP